MRISYFFPSFAAVLFGFQTAFAGELTSYTEEFTTDASNWRNAAGLQAVDWTSSGGPDGGAFASTSFNFVGSAGNATPILFRAQDEFGSSNAAFVGDWVTCGINEFSAYVRHDAPTSLTYFVRFAGPMNFPGAAKVFVIPVAPNTWTELAMDLPDSGLVFEGPFTYEQVFSSIGHVQIGVAAQGIAGVDQAIHFGLDKVSIVPEPMTLLLVAGGALCAVSRRSFTRINP